MSTEIDIIYEPNSQKKKVLAFNTPIIVKNGATINIGTDGVISSLSTGDSYNISISTFAYDPYSGSQTPVELTDSEYNYSVTFSLVPNNSLPNDLNLTDNGDGTCVIKGAIVYIVKNSYEFLVRATLMVTDKSGNFIRNDDTDYYMSFGKKSISDTFYWNPDWLSSLPVTLQTINGTSTKIYSLGKIPRGGFIDLNTSIVNPNNYDLSYTFIKNSISTQDDIVPPNIRIIKKDFTTAIIGGNIDLTIDTSTGNKKYFFNIQVENINNSSDYGTPDTRNALFEIDVLNYFDDQNNSSSAIEWVTPAGSLGEIYEGYYSYFSVKAINPDGKAITYAISPNGNLLPTGMLIDSETGLIIGKCPYNTQTITYTVIIRAYCGKQYSDRSFNFTVLPCYGTGAYTDLSIPVFADNRIFVSSYAWNTKCVDPSYIFRFNDPNYGIPLYPDIYFISGLNDNANTTGYWNRNDTSGSAIDRQILEAYTDQTQIDEYRSCFVDKLRNYHHPFDLEISGINWAPGYAPDGSYIYDIIYLSVTDGDENDYQFFDASNKEQSVIKTYLNDDEYPIANTNSDRVFTSSLRNNRLDLIQTTNRISSPTNALRPNATPGIGLTQSEGSPIWMKCPNPVTGNILGYVAAIPLVYVNPGYGKTCTINYQQNGIDELYGRVITVDRYKVSNNNIIRTHFDLNTTTGTETTFDVVNGNKNTSGTWFDVLYQQDTKFILFPKKGDSN